MVGVDPRRAGFERRERAPLGQGGPLGAKPIAGQVEILELEERGQRGHLCSLPRRGTMLAIGFEPGSRKETAIHRPVPEDRQTLLDWPPERGLTEDEARARARTFGANEILETGEPAWRRLARETVRDPMLWFLAARAGLDALLGERAEAWTLAAAALPLVAMDALLHRRTQASLEGLRGRLAARATVMRDGLDGERASEALVPGDLVLVRAGEGFPADGILVAGEGLQVDESTLTGESRPVRKRPLDRAHAPRRAPLDEVHWGQAGTRLLTGAARMRVLQTGGETLYGEIVRSSRRIGQPRTPLQQAVGSLVRALVVASALLCLALAGVRVAQGFGWGDAVVSALTLAVAALPEEFPVVLAVFLGVGTHRLARRKALVRRAASVENLGRIGCICSDKTGTLTRGELELTHLEPAPGAPPERLLARAALASRDESGDPLDEAILRAWSARGASANDAGTTGERVATFPFTEDRRRETAIVRLPDGSRLATTKGSPELVLSLCALDDAARGALEARVAALASDGHKVIACASRSLGAAAADPDADASDREPDRDLAFEGLLAFEDPVREGVADAVAQCREAGIDVVMVTGDHRATALAVARQIGLGGEAPRVLSGTELEALLAGSPDASVPTVDLVVRARPAQKLALVQALQRAGVSVAVTGDGVNDVPALQAADVGIAMSERASRSAREAAAIVLLDDCFATIVAAIAEGRQVFWNLKLAYRYLLTIHIPLVLAAALVPLAGHPLLFLPIHIVWLELVIHPSALLAFQALPARGRLAATRARGASALFSPREWGAIVLVGLLLTGVVMAGFVRTLAGDAPLGHARSLTLASLCIASASTVAGLSAGRTPAARWVVAGTLFLTAALIQTPALAARLHVTPLHAADWTAAALGGALATLPLVLEGLLRPRAPSAAHGFRRA